MVIDDASDTCTITTIHTSNNNYPRQQCVPNNIAEIHSPNTTKYPKSQHTKHSTNHNNRQWESHDANMQTHIGTPVYMAPELVQPDNLPGMGGEASKVAPAGSNGKKGYDGRKVDVWASGILLLVMLLGTFPFDHVINQDPNAKEAHLEIWYVGWSWWCTRAIYTVQYTYIHDTHVHAYMMHTYMIHTGCSKCSKSGLKSHA